MIVRSTWRGAEAGTRGRAVSESACYTGRELKTGGFKSMGCILCGKRSWLCAWTSWNRWTNPPLRFPPPAPPRTLDPGAGSTPRRSWPATGWGAAAFPRCEWSVLHLGRSNKGHNDKGMSSISQNSEYGFHTSCEHKSVWHQSWNMFKKNISFHMKVLEMFFDLAFMFYCCYFWTL